MLFNIFISDLEKGLNREAETFADDKLFKVVKSKADCVAFRGDVLTVGEWVMEFSVDKCNKVHWGGGETIGKTIGQPGPRHI